MRFHFLLLFSFFLLLNISTSFAQSQTLETKEELKVTNLGPIYNVNNVAGYFFFSIIQKRRKKLGNSLYLLQILDKDLKLVFEKEMERSKYLFLMEAALYNGNYILKFFDAKHKYNVLLSMNGEGEIIFEQKIQASSGLESEVNTPTYIFMQNRNKTLHGVKGKGVFSYTVYKPKIDKTKYAIHYFESQNTEPKWSYSPDNKNIETAEFLSIRGDTLLSAVYREILFGPKVGKWGTITGIDIKTGTLLFTKEITKGKTGFRPLRFKVESGNEEILLVGSYFQNKKFEFVLPKALGMKKPGDSPGLFFAKVKGDGSIYNINFLPQKDINSFLPQKENGKKYASCFHNIVYTNGKNTFLVHETYKAFSKKIKDIALIRLDSNFQAIGTKIFEKNEKKANSKQILPNSSSLGNWNQNFSYKNKGFDYTFTVHDDSNENFILAYLADENLKRSRLIGKERRKGIPSWAFGAVMYYEGKFIIDHINLYSEADDVFIMPAKFGYVAVVKAFKKEKRIEIALEALKTK